MLLFCFIVKYFHTFSNYTANPINSIVGSNSHSLLNFKMILLVLLLIVHIQGCMYIENNGGLCIVNHLSKDELISGGLRPKIRSILCDECYFDIDNEFVLQLLLKYPNLTKLTMSYDGEDICTSSTNLIVVRGCKEGKFNLFNYLQNKLALLRLIFSELLTRTPKQCNSLACNAVYKCLVL